MSKETVVLDWFGSSARQPEVKLMSMWVSGEVVVEFMANMALCL